MKGLFSIPNQITYIRVLLIPVFIIFFFMEMPFRDYIAAFIFIILSLSDALDGYIARKKNQVTPLGKILDPIADKLLISAALIILIGRIQLWMAVIIIIRELIITIARIFLLPKRVVISASKLGKLKTISQIAAILAVILNFNASLNWWLMLWAVAITIISGIDYFIKMGRLIGEDIINIPNMITTFRLLLIPLFIINLLKPNFNFAIVVFTIFILSDKFDGISARIANQITTFGRIYDAFTDFIFITSILIVFYMIGRIELFWIIIFLVPAISLIITKSSQYRKLKELNSTALGKIVIGISYVAIFFVIIDFVYKFETLVLIAILSYVYMIMDIYKSIMINKIRFKFF